MSEDLGFCRKCGTEIKEGDAFCSKCGTKLDTPAEVVTPEVKTYNTATEYTVPEVKQKKSSFAKKLILGIVGVVLVCVVGLSLIGSTLYNNPNTDTPKVVYSSADLQNPTKTNENYRVLNINTNPTSASVTIDGVSQGLSPIINLPLKIGTHKIDVKSGGYTPYHDTLEVSNLTAETITIEFADTNSVTSKQNTVTTNQDADVCQWDWTYSTHYQIGEYSTAPSGYIYALVSIYLKNNAEQTVSTNPYDWVFMADGIEYTHDSSTYSDVIKHQTLNVDKGGEIETQMVYLVKSTTNGAHLIYKGFGAPEMKRINHYPSSS
jgi:hypothetical protein